MRHRVSVGPVVGALSALALVAVVLAFGRAPTRGLEKGPRRVANRDSSLVPAVPARTVTTRVRRQVTPPPAVDVIAAPAEVAAPPVQRLPLVVEVVDAETGRTVPEAPVSVALGAEPVAEGGVIEEGTLWPDVFLEGGGEQSVSICVEPFGEGEARRYPDPLRRSRLDRVLSRFATSFRVIEPLRREARVALRVLRPDGTPAAVEDGLFVFYLGVDLEPIIDTAALSNALLLRGFGHLAGEPLTVRASVDMMSASGSVDLRADAADVPLLELELEPGGGGGSSSGFTGRYGCGRKLTSGGGSGRIDVTVLGRNDLPLADVFVDGGAAGGGRTDAQGRLVLEGVPEATWRLRLIEPGIGFTEMDVRVDDGACVAVTLREGPSYPLSLDVRDETGAPARFARIEVLPERGAPWVHLVDGVQTLTVMTDESGRCDLPDLPWVDVKVRALFGSRSAEVTLEPGADHVSLQLGVEGAVVLR